MGKAQKSGRLDEVENDAEATKIQAGAPSQRIDNDQGLNRERGNNPKPVSHRDAASYVHEMAIELKGIAESAKLSFLSYLLDLAIEESLVQKRGRL